MTTLELSSHVSEIPNDAYTAPSQILIGSQTLGQEYLLQNDYNVVEIKK